MLVLSRQFAESILIGDDIRITVLRENRRGSISIGIEAPRHLLVLREELLAQPETISHDTSPNLSRASAGARKLLSLLSSKK